MRIKLTHIAPLLAAGAAAVAIRLPDGRGRCDNRPVAGQCADHRSAGHGYAAGRPAAAAIRRGYGRPAVPPRRPPLIVEATTPAGPARGVSGSAACRPHLDACLDHLREGDVLTVWKLDRLGRNTQHVLAVVDQLTSRGIGFRSLTEGLHTRGRWARPC